MSFYQIDGVKPVLSSEAFVHPTATVIGDVFISAGCFVGPGAVLRGDFGPIVMKPGSNIQDNCVMHSFPGITTLIEEDSHIGHGAILHGATIRRNAMVGINAVVMDDAVVGEDSIVAAMSIVTANMQVPPQTLAMGVPAKIIRLLTKSEIQWKSSTTEAYHTLTKRALNSFSEVTPLSEEQQSEQKKLNIKGPDTLHQTRERSTKDGQQKHD